MPTVSIVTYHPPEGELNHCLDCLVAAKVDRIYVIDNGRDEATRSVAAGYPDVIYVPSDNVGYGAGHNLALRMVMADEQPPRYHLVMNSDVSFKADIMGRIVAYMDSHPDIGALQPLILSPDGTPQYTCRMLPSPTDVFMRRFLPKSWFRGRRDRYLLKHLDLSRAWNIPYHQGSFMFMRLDALRKAGLFDERFFMYPEDMDLTRRIHALSPTVYWPGVSVVHDHRAASYVSLRMLWIHVVNMIRYFNKWGWIFDRGRREYNKSIAPYDDGGSQVRGSAVDEA
ncbi:MAG: glycosyltransferase family 2 protein [Muribaculaceae bacterium]|nr:glycosyltransferase family 2 protein [Muribaculaceae bacterium]